MLRALPRGTNGILVKLAKPCQDRRVDPPNLDTRTVELAAQAGLAGIAYEAGATLAVDQPALIELANVGGLFIVGVAAA
jgi:DUF1009 family protein